MSSAAFPHNARDLGAFRPQKSALSIRAPAKEHAETTNEHNCLQLFVCSDWKKNKTQHSGGTSAAPSIVCVQTLRPAAGSMSLHTFCDKCRPRAARGSLRSLCGYMQKSRHLVRKASGAPPPPQPAKLLEFQAPTAKWLAAAANENSRNFIVGLMTPAAPTSCGMAAYFTAH
jgi:hypothetical protein